MGGVISIGLYPFLTSPIQRLAILTLAAICIIFVAAILIGPAGKSLFPRPSSPERMARFDSNKVIVGGKEFLEQDILCELVARVIEKNNPDLKVERRFKGNGTYAVYSELQQGKIDLYVEYTGTALAYLLKLPMEKAKQTPFNEFEDLFRDMNLTWLDPLGFNNSYCLVMLKQRAEELNVSSISDLSKVAGKLRIKGTKEFHMRPDGLSELQRVYGLDFAETDVVLEEKRYSALRNGEMDVTSGFATDPELYFEEDIFIKLQDDRNFFPSYFAAPLLHRDVINRFPNIKTSLGKLAGAISDRDMASLTSQGIEKGFDQRFDPIGLRVLIDKFIKDKKF